MTRLISFASEAEQAAFGLLFVFLLVGPEDRISRDLGS